jgi:succinate dehydrogenase (ubiquinone) cytochrome b560 subunit
MRITGLAMSGSFCLYPLLYLASPSLGIDVSIVSLATTFGSLPTFVKIPIKLAVAWTFTFHGFNSLRFLTWDAARGITNKRVAQTGWAVVGVSFASAVALAMLV